MEYEEPSSMPSVEEVIDHYDTRGVLLDLNGAWKSRNIQKEEETSLWVIDPVTSKQIEVDYSGALIPFKPGGYGSYQTYKCQRNKVYRIGYFELTKSKRNPSYELRYSYGCGTLDVALFSLSKGRHQEELEKLAEKRDEDWIVDLLDWFLSDSDSESDCGSSVSCYTNGMVLSV